MQEAVHVLQDEDFIEQVSKLQDWTSFAIYKGMDTYSVMMWQGEPIAVTVSVNSGGDKMFIQYDGTESVLRSIRPPFVMVIFPEKGSATVQQQGE